MNDMLSWYIGSLSNVLEWLLRLKQIHSEPFLQQVGRGGVDAPGPRVKGRLTGSFECAVGVPLGPFSGRHLSGEIRDAAILAPDFVGPSSTMVVTHGVRL